MTTLLSTAPDLTSEYWVVKRLPDLVVEQLGVRLHYDHLQRVQRARMAVEQCIGAVELQSSNNTGAVDE